MHASGDDASFSVYYINYKLSDISFQKDTVKGSHWIGLARLFLSVPKHMLCTKSKLYLAL